MANSVDDSQSEYSVTTSAGELTYTVTTVSGKAPFIANAFLGGSVIAPTDARQLLASMGHEHARLACAGDAD